MNWHICHKKYYFFVRIFDISPYVFNQISNGRAHWMQNLILHPTSTHTAKTEWDMSKIWTKKVVFFLMTNMSIQPLWLNYFIEILLVLEFQLTKTYFGTFSYKAHFRPQISSNVNKHWSKIHAKLHTHGGKIGRITLHQLISE